MSEIAIPSSGDSDKDRDRLERFARNDELIQAGNCPNGCGPMFKASERLSECTECGFIHSRNTIG